MLASQMGEKAVDLLMQGIGGQCVAIRENEIVAYPIQKALAMPSQSKKPFTNLFERLS
jgi:6-phosphofructokinase 1